MSKTKVKKKALTVRMPAQLLAEAHAAADRDEMPMSQALRNLIRRWVKGEVTL